MGAQQFNFLFSIAIFVGVTLAGVSLLTGAVLAGVFIAIGPVIGEHIPQIPNLTQLLIGVGVVTIGRNPNGIGQVLRRGQRFHGAPPADGARPIVDESTSRPWRPPPP